MPPVAILAGGLATRLYPVTQTIPKSLVEVAGKPFIVHQLERLRQQGITRVVLCVGNLGDQIVELLGNGQTYDLDIQYSFDGPALRGTGGAIQQALPLLDGTFFVLYGDSYLQCDYRALDAFFHQSSSLGVMTVFRNEGQWDKSNIIFKDGLIVTYDKHQHLPEMHYIDYGLSLLKGEIFRSTPVGQAFDLADVYRQLVREKQMAGFEVTTRFYEIGSHDGLAETRAYLEHPK
ncbi:MAG: NTP transferase domain-containing protein [Anaerolineae bacterium]|nr:NTP transferase domain-containing protein [Anaerolineae bacterium]